MYSLLMQETKLVRHKNTCMSWCKLIKLRYDNKSPWGSYSSNVCFVTPACDLVINFRIQCWKYMKKYLADHDFRVDSSAVPAFKTSGGKQHWFSGVRVTSIQIWVPHRRVGGVSWNVAPYILVGSYLRLHCSRLQDVRE